MGKFRPKRWIDHSGKKRNNYYKKGRTKLTEGHIHDQLGLGITIIAILIGIWWWIDLMVSNRLISTIITIIISVILGRLIYYIYKKI